MAQKILMPALSPTMTEGTLAKWLKKEGDAISAGDVIAEIETDKATMEFEAVDEGILARVLIPAGTQGVAVNEPIALLLEEGDDQAALDALMTASSPKVESKAAAPAAAASSSAASSVPVSRSASASGEATRVFASPLARRLAKEAGLDLSVLKGSGPRGRIVRHDIQEALASGVTARMADASSAPVASAVPKASSSPQLQPMPWQAYTAEPNTGIRKTIARRLSEAKQTVPHFYLTVDVELDALMALRKQLNSVPDAGHKLSVNDFVIKACALALQKVPAANAMWTDEAILRFDEIDISVAVATDGGLITPVIRNADRKGLATISTEMKALAKKARDGKLRPEEFQGGGFSISNLGMYGIKSFSAIINPPQSCILAVGAGEERVVVRDGAVAVRTMMTVTLSVDHRSVDGAVGAQFLAALKPLLEDPVQLML
ncbi:pyruvate dehydrogenase complex dihydrolipoamide acetyltransferase [Haematospirillum jordaniae]|uniref:Acetyltransferase component of pyruvate dehydrogenase complex n=1 Tax=Haematospirillum jordaniae TaxID=1549855 RepID=A0A143DEG8_9PROT|nr:pyruvate dehydrogenase complex dihydrolipoamide acetyltransferase [Haematospirillum jordaniae]AMW35141.1 branched-chain alpha-keto acid dehydrogenase subunit E2 [Haematospirillum jordaniae]NKD46096.1 pyruvate dehydrogenase complex dihydrolipoamide acetyltransferase [Haematospirillum jordaniae]NKD56474.1 pyruvate dehydrogenase complex dihydrolipoamide acetyltransferase [Haematospirillum jordaniae]NKD58532.1 pyruvate dehydrogenase complex dihydrolipoamide acetyltransferase [Haematospirillum jo